MAGLSVVLEAQEGSNSKSTPQVINKTTMLSSTNIHSPSAVPFDVSQHHSPLQEPTFLELCFLCRKRLLPENDIYMYKGDKAFCSEECRWKQIFMDEEESIKETMKCSFAAMRPSASASSSSTEARAHHHKRPRNNGKGGFAY